VPVSGETGRPQLDSEMKDEEKNRRSAWPGSWAFFSPGRPGRYAEDRGHPRHGQGRAASGVRQG